MSVIYNIFCKDENIKDCYIGSTNDLHRRKLNHKSTCNNINSDRYNIKLYNFIRANGGFENFDFIILEQFENKMIKQDLLKIEGQYIKNNNATLNCIIAGRTKKEWREINKKQLVEKMKIYSEKNKEQLAEYRKKYRQENQKKMKEKDKIKYEKYKEKILEQKKVKYEQNKIEINERRKEKVECEFCKSLITKQHLKRHRQSKKCIECKNNIL